MLILSKAQRNISITTSHEVKYAISYYSAQPHKETHKQWKLIFITIHEFYQEHASFKKILENILITHEFQNKEILNKLFTSTMSRSIWKRWGYRDFISASATKVVPLTRWFIHKTLAKATSLFLNFLTLLSKMLNKPLHTKGFHQHLTLLTI